jgi:hypothetical protein
VDPTLGLGRRAASAVWTEDAGHMVSLRLHYFINSSQIKKIKQPTETRRCGQPHLQCTSYCPRAPVPTLITIQRTQALPISGRSSILATLRGFAAMELYYTVMWNDRVGMRTEISSHVMQPHIWKIHGTSGVPLPSFR